jgi:hypothetical protein
MMPRRISLKLHPDSFLRNILLQPGRWSPVNGGEVFRALTVFLALVALNGDSLATHKSLPIGRSGLRRHRAKGTIFRLCDGSSHN